MKCSKCGKEIANDSKFCEHCGAQVKVSVWEYGKSHAKALMLFICVLLLSLAIGLYVLHIDNTREESAELTYVDDLSWDSPIGSATYTGYAVQVPDKGLVPHAKGVATITEGEYAGSVYDGDFDMGRMEGRARYTLNNGDVFVGEFKDNQYDKGKYVIVSSGEYFEGTFKNGEPDKGNWFDKNGNKI